MADLELEDKIDFQKKVWVTERISWFFLVAALTLLAFFAGEDLTSVAPAETIGRSAAIYFIVFVILRISGRRALSETTMFDLVLILILSEACQAALVKNDNSILTAAVVISTMVGLDIIFSLLKSRWPRIDEILDGVPTIVMSDGKFLWDRMKKARLDKEDVLEAARKSHGLSSVSQIRHAVLEKNGEISIIPN